MKIEISKGTFGEVFALAAKFTTLRLEYSTDYQYENRDDWSLVAKNNEETLALTEAEKALITEACIELIDEQYPDWLEEEGSSGIVIWSLREKTVILGNTQRVITTEEKEDVKVEFCM
jgi:hypothetical protein